jgi:ATP-binding cassette subfamily C protein
MTAVSLTEGVAVLLLLPLLQIAGVELQQGTLARISSPLRSVFTAIGIPQTLVAVLVAYAAVTIAQASLVRVQSIQDAKVVQDYTQNLRSHLYGAIARSEWLTLSRIRSSDFTFALTIAIDRLDGAAHQLLYLGASGAVMIVYVVMSVAVSPAMSAVVLGLVVLLLLAQTARTFGIREPGEEMTESTSEMYATAAEQLGGLKTAKSYGSEARHLAMFLETGLRVNRASIALTRSYAALRWRQSAGSVVGLCVILYIAITVFHLPTAATLLLLFLFSRLVPRMITLQQTVQQVIGALPALRIIRSLIDTCERSAEHDAVNQIPVESGLIGVRGLSFSYGGKGTSEALSDVNLEIPDGMTTAVVGASGSGKTTLADLLLGLLRPDTGEVSVGSARLDPAHLESWRAQIGYVAQDTYLFNATVRANLEWARPGATEADMRESLRQAAADEFVSRMSNGIDTVIGERGVRLSGGEKQRLSLARALLRKPRLLILDEATSALDSENEERIYDAIEKLHGEVTILVITHRLSTIRSADLIHVMDRGHVVASGNWDTLMAGGNSRFRELCAAQGIGPR